MIEKLVEERGFAGSNVAFNDNVELFVFEAIFGHFPFENQC